MLNKSFAFLPEADFERMKALPEDDPESLKLRSTLQRKQISYYLSHAAIQDIYDIVLLAANGKGAGALKIVRGMYEHLVTARFIVLNPDEAKPFIADLHLRGAALVKYWNEVVPEVLRKQASEAEIKTFEDQAASVQAERRQSICKKCGQLKPDALWTKTNLYDMAQKVGQGLDELYTECYRIPSAYHHATALGLQFKATSSGDLSAGRRDGALAVILCHQLLLNALRFQNEFFELNLASAIAASEQEFHDILGEKLDRLEDVP